MSGFKARICKIFLLIIKIDVKIFVILIKIMIDVEIMTYLKCTRKSDFTLIIKRLFHNNKKSLIKQKIVITFILNNLNDEIILINLNINNYKKIIIFLNVEKRIMYKQFDENDITIRKNFLKIIYYIKMCEMIDDLIINLKTTY